MYSFNSVLLYKYNFFQYLPQLDLNPIGHVYFLFLQNLLFCIGMFWIMLQLFFLNIWVKVTCFHSFCNDLQHLWFYQWNASMPQELLQTQIMMFLPPYLNVDTKYFFCILPWQHQTHYTPLNPNRFIFVLFYHNVLLQIIIEFLSLLSSVQILNEPFCVSVLLAVTYVVIDHVSYSCSGYVWLL